MARSNTLPTVPSAAEADQAREGHRRIAKRVNAGASVGLQIEDQSGSSVVPLPSVAAKLVLELLDALAHGNAVSLATLDSELTTQQAADLLNISRPSLIMMLEQGELPYRRLGTHRRIPLADVLAFKSANTAKRQATLDEMSALHQVLGLE